MGKPATATKTANTATTATGNRPGRKAGANYVAPEITTISTAIPIPTSNRRGSTSSYPFASLEVGQSFGIKNKKAVSISSIVSAQNRKTREKRDANGQIVMLPGKPITDNNGAIVGHSQGEPETERYQTFVYQDVDPATDPDGATVRVWRTK